MSKPPQNETQFKILKIFTDWPKANLKKVAKVFELHMATVMAVQASANYSNYLERQNGGGSGNSSLDDMINDMGLGGLGL